MHPNMLGRIVKGEGKLVNITKLVGTDKMLLSKMSFFYLTGNVFTAYCFFKAAGWVSSFVERRQSKIYEEKIMEFALKDAGIDPTDANCKILLNNL